MTCRSRNHEPLDALRPRDTGVVRVRGAGVAVLALALCLAVPATASQACVLSPADTVAVAVPADAVTPAFPADAVLISAAVRAAAGAVVSSGDTWSYRYASGTPTPGWNARGFDAAGAGFASGPSPIGFGSTGLGTDIDVQPAVGRPLAVYVTKQVQITDPSKPLTLTLPADDGLAVYVNGTEVGRVNLPTGTLRPTTYATAAVRRTAATVSPARITVPASLLVAGANTLAAEIHLNYRATPDITFDMTARQ